MFYLCKTGGPWRDRPKHFPPWPTVYHVFRRWPRTAPPSGLEPHQQYSKHADGLDRIYSLVNSPAIGINFDTGNSHLCGHDALKWPARGVDRLVHLHAKDISDEQSSAERGKATGTPVGCACAMTRIDWPSDIEICRKARRHIVLSVECSTVEQAERLIDHLQSPALCVSDRQFVQRGDVHDPASKWRITSAAE